RSRMRFRSIHTATLFFSSADVTRHSYHRFCQYGHSAHAVKFDLPESNLRQQGTTAIHGEKLERPCIVKGGEVPVELTSQSKRKIFPEAMICHRQHCDSAGFDQVK